MNTDTLAWLDEHNRASQDKREVADFIDVVAPINPKWIMEIGLHRGYSVEIWDKLLLPQYIIGIEPPSDDVDYFPIETEFSYLRGLSTDQSIYDQVIVTLNGEPKLDMLFIDGDHRYDTVKQDFDKYGPLVRTGGIIAFHDVCVENNNLVDVPRFWGELCNKFPTQTRTINYPGGMGIGVFRQK